MPSAPPSPDGAAGGEDPQTESGRRAFFGRRQGRPLREGRSHLVETLLPALALDLAAPPPADLGGLFPGARGRLALEIGFGGGEHLVRQALAQPETGFIGCEPFLNGMSKVLSAIAAAKIDNVRLHAGDAGDVVDWLPAASLSQVYLLYPDPWPKKRHWKRRFVQPAMLDRVARAMRPGAELRFASDIPHYVDWTLKRFLDHPDFVWTATRSRDWLVPWAGWESTRYEAKALAAGRRSAYLTFIRR